MSQRASKTKTAATTTTTTTATTTKVTASDDWDTDPDFVRDMDEMDQRWGGNKRTVGSINMEELIDDVRREHRNLRDKYGLSSGDFPRSDFVEKQLHRTDSPTKITTSANNFNKLSTEEMKREVMRSETSSYVKERNGASILSETTKQVRGGGSPTSNYRTTSAAAAATAESPRKSPIPPLAPKPDFEELASRLSRGRATPSESTPARRFEKDTFITTDPPQQFKESTLSKSTFREEKSSASSSSAQNSKTSSSNNLSPSAFSRSIQDRIDAFKKEFEDIEHKVARKSDISKVIKKTTNSSSSSNVDKKSANDAQSNDVSQSNERVNSPGNTRGLPSYRSPDSVRRPASAAPFHGDDAAYQQQQQQQQQTKPKANIKSLSERFETLGRESSDDFKRRMEARRREFFDRIKTQVRETRKGLDGFDIDDSEDDDNVTRKAGGMRQFVSKLNTSIGTPAYKLSEDSFPPRPKVYTRRETTQEEVVSHVIKEDDRVVHDETKRNVEKTSSCHGSSDEEAEPSSIKYLDRELRKHSPQQQQRTQSPIDEIKRKVPVVELEARSAGLMARTLYDYQAAEEDELCFEVDDLITNIEKVDQGWYKGTITKGVTKRVGLFPANYVKLLNDTSEY